MGTNIYKRKYELFKEWTTIYNSMHCNISFEEYQRLYEKEDAIYRRWIFYKELLKRLEVVNRGEQKKKCYKKENSTYKRSKTTTTI